MQEMIIENSMMIQMVPLYRKLNSNYASISTTKKEIPHHTKNWRDTSTAWIHTSSSRSSLIKKVMGHWEYT